VLQLWQPCPTGGQFSLPAEWITVTFLVTGSGYCAALLHMSQQGRSDCCWQSVHMTLHCQRVPGYLGMYGFGLAQEGGTCHVISP